MFCKTDVRNSAICYIFRFLILLLIFSNQQLSSFFTSADEGFAIKNKADCDKLENLTSCQCGQHALKYEIICPKELNNKNSIKMIMPPDHHYLEFKCLNNDGLMPEMPKLNIGCTNLVKINYCQPPKENTSFSDLFAKLNLTNVAKLYITNDDSNTNLRQHHLNGLDNLIQLSLTLRNSVPLHDDLFDGIGGKLVILILRTYQAELPENFFASLTNIKQLTLFLHNVRELPPDIFRYNEKLLTLSLGQSKISHLRKAIFKNLTAISSLSISGNYIKTIESNIFDEILNLTAISLNNNHLENLPEGIFKNTKNLKKFCLNQNRAPLRLLPATLLANLPDLHNVSINCRLEHITPDIFANSTMIERLYLEENKLAVLPENLFFDQINLLELDLSKNFISELPTNLFVQNTKIKILKLSNNKLEQITGLIFKPLTSLEELMIDNNYLTSIDANAFVGLIKLTTLELQNNRISFNDKLAETPIHKLQSLKFLNLCNNNIKYAFFERDFVQNSLENLDICHNNVSIIDLNKLQRISKQELQIDLSNNQIESIVLDQDFAEPIGNPTIHLNLKENPINCDCKLLEFVKFLKSKRARNMQFQPTILACQEPAALRKTALLKLSPADLLCQSEDCPTSCKCYERKEDLTLLVECIKLNDTSMLDLSNFLKSQHFQTATKAFEVNLESNNITKLPKMSVGDFDKITRLKLAGNKLTEIGLQNLPRNLSHLDLRNNKFKTLNKDILEYFEKGNSSKTLQLSGNPWQCDCKAQALLKFAQKNFETLIDSTEMACGMDSGMSNNSIVFHQLHISDICPDRTLIIGLSISSLVILFLVIITFLHIKFNLEIKIWLFSHNICLCLVTEAELDKDKIYDAFISYSSKDEQFVVEQLVPKLENGTPPFKVCVHYRNFLVGASIPANIANAVENSHRTIIVLSKNFLESDWALHEFRSAHLAALDEKKPKVIVILYGDIGNIEAIDAELQAYLKTKTYLAWSDPKFWDRLRYALPHSRTQSNDFNMQPIQNGYAIVKSNVRSA